MEDNLFLIIVLIILCVVLTDLTAFNKEYEKEVKENIKNNEIIETHVNVNRAGNNEYFIIIENKSGDLIEYNVDLNTYVKFGGKLKGE